MRFDSLFWLWVVLGTLAAYAVVGRMDGLGGVL